MVLSQFLPWHSPRINAKNLPKKVPRVVMQWQQQSPAQGNIHWCSKIPTRGTDMQKCRDAERAELFTFLMLRVPWQQPCFCGWCGSVLLLMDKLAPNRKASIRNVAVSPFSRSCRCSAQANHKAMPEKTLSPSVWISFLHELSVYQTTPNIPPHQHCVLRFCCSGRQSLVKFYFCFSTLH